MTNGREENNLLKCQFLNQRSGNRLQSERCSNERNVFHFLHVDKRDEVEIVSGGNRNVDLRLDAFQLHGIAVKALAKRPLSRAPTDVLITESKMTSYQNHYRRNLKTFAHCRGIVTVSGKSVLELIAKRLQDRTSTQALFRTSFQSESHPVPLGPLDPLGQLLKDRKREEHY